MKQRVVIKLGGSSLQLTSTLSELSALIKGYRQKNYEVVLVHGGGPAINQELTRRGIEWKFIEGQRQTTPEMIEVIDQVLGHDINAALVSSLAAANLPARGLSGARDKILFCVQANADLMQVGTVQYVDTTAIEEQLSLFGAPVPVIAPIGIGAQNEKYNVNADWAAAQIAIALKAKELVFLTDQIGILDENREIVKKATPLLMRRMIDSGVISGGMCTKVRAMMKALEGGVKKVRVLHASAASRLLIDGKAGTILADHLTQTQREPLHGYAS